MFALGLKTAIGVLVLFGGRSEMIRGLRGDGRDEYWERIDMRATLFSGVVTLTVIIGMCLWEWVGPRPGRVALHCARCDRRRRVPRRARALATAFVSVSCDALPRRWRRKNMESR